MKSVTVVDFEARVSKTLDVPQGSHLVGITSSDLAGADTPSVTLASMTVVQSAVDTYLKDRG